MSTRRKNNSAGSQRKPATRTTTTGTRPAETRSRAAARQTKPESRQTTPAAPARGPEPGTSHRSLDLPQAADPQASNQREHTRYAKALPVRIFKRRKDNGDGPHTVDFSASVDTRDISAGGVFLKSTFFLKKGFEMEIEMDLPGLDRTVRASGVVARIIDDGTTSGFAIRFLELHDDSEIYLRAFLTQGDMFAFVDRYAPEILPGVGKKQHVRLVELIVRWEIYQESLSR